MAWTDYTPRFLGPTYLERDRPTPLRLGIYFGSASVVVASGTISIYDPANTAVVSGAAVTVDAAGFATYSLLAATVASYNFAQGWRVEWSLVCPDTYTHVFRNSAALVRVHLPPAATEADLLRLHPDLRNYLPNGQSSWQDQIDVAWEFAVVGKLEGMGRRPYLVVSQSSLVPPHTYEALAVIGAVLNAGGDETTSWGRFQTRYEKLAATAWANCAFVYDESDSGNPNGSIRAAATPTIWLSSTGAY